MPDPEGAQDAADLDGTDDVDDPITWCDCRPDEECPPGQLCRQRKPHRFAPRNPEDWPLLCVTCGLVREDDRGRHIFGPIGSAPEPAQPRELNGNPTPHTSMPDPEAAKDAAERAETALLDQIRACRTAGELDMLYERTGFAWTVQVKDAATRHRADLPGLAQAGRRGAALMSAIGAATSQAELSLLFTDPRNADIITPAHKEAARARARIVPSF
jgi:hypothetical protein